MEFDKKLETFRQKFHKIPPRNIIKNEKQIQGLRESSKINVAVLDYVAERIHAGMTTEDIDRLVYEKTTQMGGIPAPLNYEGFPKSVCTSINDQVCHGIPSDNIQIIDGDIINVDCSTIYKGYYSDSSRMFCIGNVSAENKKLVKVAKECVELGLKQVVPWGHLGDVAQVINDHAKANGYTVVREVGGHGIGLAFHETPFVSYVIRKGTGMVMAPGMVFTIEPMINMGTSAIYIDDSNGWTIYTDDEKPSAQWEIMVLVTETGYEVLSW
jgi:methionyl aminopeptidase